MVSSPGHFFSFVWSIFLTGSPDDASHGALWLRWIPADAPLLAPTARADATVNACGKAAARFGMGSVGGSEKSAETCDHFVEK